MPVINDTTYIF